MSPNPSSRWNSSNSSRWFLTLFLVVFASAIITFRILSSDTLVSSHQHVQVTQWLEKRGIHTSFFNTSVPGAFEPLQRNYSAEPHNSNVPRNNSITISANTTILNRSTGIVSSSSSSSLSSSFSSSPSSSSSSSASLSSSSNVATHTSDLRLNSPLKSPGLGTDVISDPLTVLKCFNQSRCITPQLNLDRTFRVYFCRHIKYGVRFFYLARESVLLHPRVVLVNDPHDAEVVIYLPVSSEWDKSECNNPALRHKTVVLDEGDWPDLFEPEANTKWLLYFKRSYVRRKAGDFHAYMNYATRRDVLPMTYPLAKAYIRDSFPLWKNRNIEILCTLRGSKQDPARLRVSQWLKEYAASRGIKNATLNEVNYASRTVVSREYFDFMYRSRIIVTANPSHWEGDFRFCESMASGALVFVDKMYVPRPFPFVNNQHIVVYDNKNQSEFFAKLDYYRHNLDVLEKVAIEGYLHAMTHHRTVNTIDYVLRTVQFKLEHPEMFSSPVLSPPWRDILTPAAGQEAAFANTGFELRNTVLHYLAQNHK